MFHEANTDSEAAVMLGRMNREYLGKAGTEPGDAEVIIDEIYEQEHCASQIRFDGDALEAVGGDVPVAPVEVIKHRAEASSEYFRATIIYLPEDISREVFQQIIGALRIESDWVLQSIKKIERTENKTATERQKIALHCIYHDRLPYHGRGTLPYCFGEQEEIQKDPEEFIKAEEVEDLPCTDDLIGTKDALAASIDETLKGLIRDDEFGKATFENLREIGRWFHRLDIEQYIKQYDERYEPALELLYGILELRRLSVILGRTTRERSLDSALEFGYLAVVTQAHIKIRWRNQTIERMKQQGDEDDEADGTDG